MSFGKFVGRVAELRLLDKMFRKSSSSLVVIKGRRRIGKSRLVDEFGKKYTLFKFAGLPPTSRTLAQSQREEFIRQLCTQFRTSPAFEDDWGNLFHLLAQSLPCNKKVVVLFDEISWMGDKDPLFLGKLKNAWDLYFKNHKQLVLILCGSVSTWIDKNILSSTGFVGRISLELTLGELGLRESREFWYRYSHDVANDEKLQLLMVTGGVPKYLEEVDYSTSAWRNIFDLCFSKQGFLFNEFDKIFSDLFKSKARIYREIVERLAYGSANRTEISKSVKLPANGVMSDYLYDLQTAGFVARDYTWDISTSKSAKLSRYRLRDNYLRFYLRYVFPNKDRILQDNFSFKSLNNLHNWNSVMGLQFENLVIANKHLLFEELDIDDSHVVYSNQFFQTKTSRRQGCQIDYVIQTVHNEIYVVEIKFSKNKIEKSIIPEVQNKLDSLVIPKGYSIRKILIHVNEVVESVKDTGYFNKIIDYTKIF